MEWVPKSHFASNGHVWSLFKGFAKLKTLIIFLTNQGVKSVYWASTFCALQGEVIARYRIKTDYFNDRDRLVMGVGLAFLLFSTGLSFIPKFLHRRFGKWGAALSLDGWRAVGVGQHIKSVSPQLDSLGPC